MDEGQGRLGLFLEGMSRVVEMLKRSVVLQNLLMNSALAAIIVTIGFGTYAFFQGQQGAGIWVLALSMVVGAVAFVASSTHAYNQGYHHQACLLWGALAAAVFTVLTLSLWISALYFVSSEVTSTLLAYLVLAFAVALMGSSSLMWVVKGRQEQSRY